MTDSGQVAVQAARRRFLDDANTFGCAETTLAVLREAFGLPDTDAAAAALALNGGIAYTGAMCGALTGAALALGELAARRISDRHLAKGAARSSVQALIDEFDDTFGAVDCRALIGQDLRAPGAHDAFIASGIWRDRCMTQIEFAIRRSIVAADASEG